MSTAVSDPNPQYSLEDLLQDGPIYLTQSLYEALPEAQRRILEKGERYTVRPTEFGFTIDHPRQ